MAKKNFQSKFKRIEKKYLIHQSKLEKLNHIFKNYLEKDDYAISTISNLYFDTDNYYMIRSSIEKAAYKEKLRMRSYDASPKDSSKVFLEIKKKFEKVIYKRRISTSLAKGNEYLLKRENVLESSQIKDEIDWMFKINKDLKPMMYIYYDRFSLKAKDGSELRITFDHNILYRNYDLDIKKGIYGDKLLDDDYFIMEIKVEGAYPIWLSHILDQLEIYPRPFSKYGYAYKQIKERRGIDNARFII